MLDLILNSLHVNITGLLFFSGALISLCVGLLVCLYNPRNKTNLSFFLISLFGFVWLLSYSFILILKDTRYLSTLIGLSYPFGVTALSPSVFWFVQNWTGYKKNKIHTLTAYGIGLILGLILLFNSSFLSPVESFSFGRFNTYGHNWQSWTYVSLVLLHMILYALYSLWLVFLKWKNTKSPNIKRQYLIFIIGAAIGYISITDFLVTLKIFPWPIGYASFTLYILCMAFATLRFQFLEVNFQYKKAFLLVLIYGLLFSFLIPLIIPYFAGHFMNQPFQSIIKFLTLCLGTGVFLSLGPLIYANLIRRSFWLKENMSKGLTHELKSPISAILGITGLLKESLDRGESNPIKTKDYVQIIEKNALRLDNFSQDLLNIAKSDEKSHSIRTTPTDLSIIISSEIEIATPAANSKGLVIKATLPEELIIPIDPEKIRQVISNLLSNSIKYSKKGEISITLKQENKLAAFSIKDEGKGILKSDLEKIFQRFYQGNSASRGAGLGLAIAKTWIEAHRGKIWAESEGEGKGTVISFSLPMD